MTLADFSKAALCACLFPGFLLLGADDTVPSPLRRLTIGIHVMYFPLPLVNGRNVITITENTNPVEQYNYSSSSTSPKWGPGVMAEYRLTNHWGLAGEIHFHHVDYTENATIYTGYNSSTTGGDNRPVTTTSTYSQVNYYEYPLLAHYYGLWSHGWKKRIFFTGGVELRHVGKIRTGNDFTYPSGETDYNENPATPNKVNDLGVVAGLGMRFIDEFHIRIVPEMRFIRWQAPTLQGASYASVLNELEAGASLSF
ncbi:MAG TPA: outer membrane beta-barrel protein [Bryobacteraceae bacterium]|jgi:hypothetical protein|nr:outer membrane beta-barrel protein [Bryobacteraceae bacterium]